MVFLVGVVGMAKRNVAVYYLISQGHFEPVVETSCISEMVKVTLMDLEMPIRYVG